MLKDNLFQKILDKQIPAKIAYEDDRCLAFHDVNPQAPVHVLIIPRKAIATHADLTDGDRDLLGHMHLVAVKLAKQLGAHSFLVKPLKFQDLLQLNCVLPANKSLKITSVLADDPENV